jgi:hypothetical protein
MLSCGAACADTQPARNSGWVAKENNLVVLECITDGFSNIEQTWLFNHLTIQKRRSDSWQIELRGTVASNLVIGALVGDNGFVEVSIYSSTAESRKGLVVFYACLDKYEVPKPNFLP